MAATKGLRFLSLDATGTLLRPRARIGATYVAHWQRVASSLAPSPPLTPSRRAVLERAVDAAFPLAFRAHAARFPNFGRRADPHAPTAERWWRHVVLASLPEELVAPLPRDAQRELTKTLYAHYASGAAWRVFDDARVALETLHARGVRMAVVSDFDERLPRLLIELGLAPFFETVTTSWDVGETKPSRAIFEHTFQELAGASFDPSEFLHVGDHVGRDYDGARAAGAHARLLDRHHSSQVQVPREHVLTTLEDVVPLLL